MNRKTVPTSPRSEERQQREAKKIQKQGGAQPHVLFAAIVASLLFGTLSGAFGFAFASSVPNDWPVVGRLNIVSLFEEQRQQVLLSSNRQEPSVVQRAPQVVQRVASLYSGIPFQDEEAQFVGHAITVTSDGWLAAPTALFDSLSAAPLVLVDDGAAYPIVDTVELAHIGITFIYVNATNLVPATFHENSVLSPGQSVWAIERSLGSYAVYEQLIAGALNDDEYVYSTDTLEQRYTLSTTAEHPVGTPIFASDGSIAGIFMADGTVLPGSVLAGAVETVQSNVALIEPSFTATYVNLAHVPTAVKQAENLPDNGIWIREVLYDDSVEVSAAQLQTGDVITYINNQFMDAEDDLSTILYSQQRGATFYMTVLRGTDANAEVQLQVVY